jgi:hypothetical protein
MRRLIAGLLCLLLTLVGASRVLAQASFDVVIESPAAGQAVQGQVEITGNTGTFGFTAYELSFSAQDDPTQTWFPIQRSSEPVRYDTLGVWDTGNLIDGTYSLRLVVELSDEEPVTVIVRDIRVRNYTPVETNTPAPTSANAVVGTATPSPTPEPPTPTALPPNPAEVRPAQIRTSLICGAAFGLLGLAALGIYSYTRRR